MPSSGVGVIGRRSVSDFGAIGDNLSGTSAASGHDQLYNLQMLEAAYHRLPQPKDSERARNYTPVWMGVYLCVHQVFHCEVVTFLCLHIFRSTLHRPLLVSHKFRHQLSQTLHFGKDLVVIHYLQTCYSLHSTTNRSASYSFPNSNCVFIV
jgi:hypothetical protein